MDYCPSRGPRGRRRNSPIPRNLREKRESECKKITESAAVKAAAGTTTEKYKIYGPRNPFTGGRTWIWGYRPAIRYEEKNHGEWSRVWVRMENAADELDVKIRSFRKTAGKPELRFQI